MACEQGVTGLYKNTDTGEFYTDNQCIYGVLDDLTDEDINLLIESESDPIGWGENLTNALNKLNKKKTQRTVMIIGLVAGLLLVYYFFFLNKK